MRGHKVPYSGIHVNTRPSDGSRRAAAGAGGGSERAVEGEAEGRSQTEKGAGLTKKRGGAYQEVGVAYPKVGVSRGLLGGAKGEGARLKTMATPPPAHSSREGITLMSRPLSIDEAHFSP